MNWITRIIAPAVLLATTAAGIWADAPAQKNAVPKDRLETLWTELESDDGVQAQFALLALAEIPDETVAFLTGRLQLAPVDPRRIAQWIEDLDSPQFLVRQTATRELELVVNQAAPRLHKALAGKPSLEVSKRIERLLGQQQESAHRQIFRGLALLEQIGSAQARRHLEKIAAGDEEAWTTSAAQASLKRLQEPAVVPMRQLWADLSGNDVAAAARACLSLAGNP